MAVQNQARFDFRGGLSRLRRQSQNQVYYLKNLRSRADGILEVRGGQELVASVGSDPTTGSIQALFGLQSTTRGRHLYSIKRENTPNDIIYDNNSAILGPNFGQGTYSTIAYYKDVIFFSNGVKPINYHEPLAVSAKRWGSEIWGTSPWGTTPTRAEVTGTPTPPKGQFIKIYKDRMYVGADDGNVFYSNAGLFATLPVVDFPALNFQPIGSVGDPITGLALGEGFLIAFLGGGYSIMTGVPGDNAGLGDMAWETFTDVGLIASRAVASKGRRTAFFGSDRRIYVLDGSILTDIDRTDKVAEYLHAVSSSVLYACSIVFVGNEIWIYLPKSSSADDGHILIYNELLQNWTIFENIKGFSFTFIPELGKVYVGSAVGGYIWEQDTGANDSGTLIPVEMISRQEVFGTFSKKKVYHSVSIQVDQHHGESLAALYSLNGTSEYTAFSAGTPVTADSKLWGSEVWGVSAWGINGSISKVMQFASDIRPRGYETRIKLSGSASAKTRILGYEIAAEVEQRDEEE